MYVSYNFPAHIFIIIESWQNAQASLSVYSSAIEINYRIPILLLMYQSSVYFHSICMYMRKQRKRNRTAMDNSDRSMRGIVGSPLRKPSKWGQMADW